MFCKYCGTQIDNSGEFCPTCGKNLNGSVVQTDTKTQLHWILIFVAIDLLLLSLLLGLNLGDEIEANDVILPAVLSLGSVVLVGYVFMDTRNKSEKKKHILSLIVLIGGILMAVELCIGPLIGIMVG